jgi:folylpolyglutamate synthase/dihydropteroate synthase
MIASAEEFVRLRNSSNSEDYLRAATDSAAVEVWLEVLKSHPSYRVWVAHNKSVPISILEILSTDSDPSVRLAVAIKNKLPAELLARLASDEDESVRQRVAYNKNVSVEVLEALARDSSESVSSAARHKLSTSQDS